MPSEPQRTIQQTPYEARLVGAWRVVCTCAEQLLLLRAPQGFLAPVSNPQYWIGLQADGWPSFKWSDSMVPSPLEKGGFSNWGTYYDPNNPNRMYVAEPNNLKPSEYCAVGNFSEGTGKPFTWAWADTSCFSTFVSICRINRECTGHPLPSKG
jgi:hypothetical protein